jgi:CDP-diacylglycerol--glycerol-3-phosphate 3-phosphatidyltransferase
LPISRPAAPGRFRAAARAPRSFRIPMHSTLPNRLTVLRILLSPVFFVLFISERPGFRTASLVVFVVAALTDWYDGELARRRNAVSNLGKFLDPLADKFLTSAAFIGFGCLGLAAWWMVAVILARDALITALRALAESRSAHIVTSKFAQWKTFIQMLAQYWLLLLVVARENAWLRAHAGSAFDALLHPTLVDALMLALTVITILSGAQYLYDNAAFIRELLRTRKRAVD